MKKPVFIFQKNVDKNTNKMIIPRFLVKQWGYRFSMEVFEDRIVLKPLDKEKEE